jgi:hypothetical protein
MKRKKFVHLIHSQVYVLIRIRFLRFVSESYTILILAYVLERIGVKMSHFKFLHKQLDKQELWRKQSFSYAKMTIVYD